MRRNAALMVLIALVSGFGSTAMSVAAGIWVLDLTASSRLAALIGLCVYAPGLAGPWLGGLADRIPRRPLLVVVNLALAGILLSLFVVRTAGQAWLIFAVSLAYGVSYVVIDAAETALLPDALPSEQLANVNGWRSSALEGTKLLAPLAGAGLYAWHGGHAVVVLSAAAPVLVAAAFPFLRLSGGPAAVPDEPPQRGIRAGLAVFRRAPALKASVLIAAVAVGFSGFQVAASYSVVTVSLGLPATFLGVMGSAQGAGSIASGLVAGRLVTRAGPVPIAAAGTLLNAAGLLVRCVPWWPALLISAALIGAGLPLALIAALTATQTESPAALRGRVAATANTVIFGPVALTTPLGSLALGLGARPVLLLAAAACVVAVVAFRRRGPVSRPGAAVVGLGNRAREAGPDIELRESE